METNDAMKKLCDTIWIRRKYIGTGTCVTSLTETFDRTNNVIFPCIWNAFKEQQLFNRNYVYIQDVLAEYLFDLDNPHVQKHDFNICMMYFTLHNWTRVSFLVIGSFIAKKFDIFRDIYERMKYNMCIMNNSIHHIFINSSIFPHSKYTQ